MDLSATQTARIDSTPNILDEKNCNCGNQGTRINSGRNCPMDWLLSFLNGNAGMDSSRSGLLSTLLMTLPLIVVPAIALLRPPGHTSGVSTVPLDAANLVDEIFPDEFTSAEESPGDSRKKSANELSRNIEDEFGGLFDEDPGELTNDWKERQPSNDVSKADPFNPFDSPQPESSEKDPTAAPPLRDASQPGAAEKIVEQLNVQGAVRTMWFEAGARSPVGFAAFFRGQTELMRIRFEAVGGSREECAQNVLRQVNQWQAEQAAQKSE